MDFGIVSTLIGVAFIVLLFWLYGGTTGRDPIPRLIVRKRRWRFRRARRRGFEVRPPSAE